MKYLILVIIILSFGVCSPGRSKKDYKFTVPVIDKTCPIKLYKECYRSFSGYLTTDIDAVYLNDSTNFRKFIGKFDEGDETIGANCQKDSVVVRHLVFSSEIGGPKVKVIKTTIYSIDDLKEEKSY